MAVQLDFNLWSWSAPWYRRSRQIKPVHGWTFKRFLVDTAPTITWFTDQRKRDHGALARPRKEFKHQYWQFSSWSKLRGVKLLSTPVLRCSCRHCIIRMEPDWNTRQSTLTTGILILLWSTALSALISTLILMSSSCDADDLYELLCVMYIENRLKGRTLAYVIVSILLYINVWRKTKTSR